MPTTAGVIVFAVQEVHDIPAAPPIADQLNVLPVAIGVKVTASFRHAVCVADGLIAMTGNGLTVTTAVLTQPIGVT